jgi:hypothetical protein
MRNEELRTEPKLARFFIRHSPFDILHFGFFASDRSGGRRPIAPFQAKRSGRRDFRRGSAAAALAHSTSILPLTCG